MDQGLDNDYCDDNIVKAYDVDVNEINDVEKKGW